MATTKFTKKVPKKTPAKDIEDAPEVAPARGKRTPSRATRGQRADTQDADIRHKTRGAAKAPAPTKAATPRRRRPAPGAVPAAVEASLTEDRGGPTAKRNAKKRAPKATSALEGSLEERPSRKSTRGSANRAKAGTELTKREIRRTSSPEKRAERANADKGTGRGAGKGGVAKVPRGGGGKSRTR